LGGVIDVEGRWAELGQFIRAQRDATQMSVRRLAETAGVSNPYLSQIERGLRKPSAEILQQIAKALRISVETLYVHAGILDRDDEAHSSVIEAISSDDRLTADQRHTLITVYESFLAQNVGPVVASAAPAPTVAEPAPAGPPRAAKASPRKGTSRPAKATGESPRTAKG
jgi:transcriptional regulator with XRE-family HTH domain